MKVYVYLGLRPVSPRGFIHHSYLGQAESQMLKACLYITKIRTGEWGVRSLSTRVLGTRMEDGAMINTAYL